MAIGVNMFNHLAQKNRAYYAEFDSLFYGMLGKITELNDKKFSELASDTESALRKDDYPAAKTYGTAAAYFFGTPGLLLLNAVLTKDIKKMVEEDEVIEQTVLNAMTYLMLAEKLFKNDDPSQEMIQKIMGNAKFGIESFKPLKSGLSSLWELSKDQLGECQETADEIAKRCLDSSPSIKPG
jgi:hypothetical protein